MLVLFETPAGFALFKVLDEGKLKKGDLSKYFKDVSSAQKVVELFDFQKFENTAEALSAATALNESTMNKALKRFLKKKVGGETLGVSDSKLGGDISDALGIKCVANTAVHELMRGIRSQINSLVAGLSDKEMNAMVLGLSHSLSRYKIKFSPDKVDTMIVQAIGLLDELDKELNTYAMRVKEWYGWHFPEMQKIVADNIAYAKVVKTMGTRSGILDTDLSKVLPEELEQELKEIAQISMGTEVSDEDIANIQELCDQVIEMDKYRAQLYEYLRNRMIAIAPNLTVLVGELVGARLIAHAGSLMNLAKHPASTVQILGAEKALFRALKTKHATPKYGLIYHASLIGKASNKNKGKMSRVLANKCALSIRVDALGEKVDASIGTSNLEKVENRLRQLEGREIHKASSTPRKSTMDSYDHARGLENSSTLRTPSKYNTAEDSTLAVVDFDDEEKMDVDSPSKKKKKEKKRKRDDDEESPKKRRKVSDDSDDEDESPKKKKKEKKKKSKDDDESPSKKKKEKKKKKSKD